MDNRLKRFLSLAMAIIMVIGLMPANVVFAAENEGEPHVCSFEDIITTPATYDARGVVTPTCSCGETQATKDICATGCMVKDTMHSTCKIKCDKKTECTLVKGHADVCMNGETVLVDVSNVFSEKGLLAAVGTGGSIKLTENIELNAAVTIQSTMTLDLNGKAITFADGKTADYALINKGTLTVKGGNIAGIMNEGTLTIESGTFTATDSDTYALYNKGTATVKGGTFNAKGGQYAVYNYSAKEISFQDARVNGAYNASGVMSVGSGKFYGNAGSGAPSVYSMGGSLTIKGGEFHNNQTNVATVILGDTCSAVISGGTITNEANAPALSVQTNSGYGATISNGAVFKSGIEVADGGALTINGGTFRDTDGDNFHATGTVDIAVNGGTYEDEKSQNFARIYAQEGKILIFKEDNQEVKKVRSAPNEVSDVIATTGSGDAIVGHPTLAGAVAVGGTVDMVADTVLEETVEVSKAVILNLNGRSIGADYLENGAIYVKAGGSLTVNGTGSLSVNTGVAIVNHGALVVNGGTISGLLNGDYAADTATATLSGGTLDRVGNNGRMTVSGATVSGWLETFGIFEMTGGRIASLRSYGVPEKLPCGISTTIKGGKVDYLESCDYDDVRFGNVITIDAGAQNTVPEVGTICAAKEEDAQTNSRIDIKNGKIGSVDAYQFDDFGNEIPGASVAGMISITGGTFNKRPDEVFVKSGYEVVENPITGGVVYIVQLKKVVLGDPSLEVMNNLLTNNGADDSITSSQVLADIKNNENLEKVTNESGYTLVISPKHVVIEAGSPYKTSRITYSVSPVDLLGNKISKPGKSITFNLPIPGMLPDHVDYANVYHGNEKMVGPETDGIFAVKGEGNHRYVTVTSDSFSDFTVELIDIDFSNHVAKIGVKGYASVQAAVDAVKDGETIELLALPEHKVYGPAEIDLSQNKSFTIDGAATINNAPTKRAWYYDGGATITFTGVSPENKTVTIKNIEFNRVNKATGEFINITGSYSRTHVLIENCDFKGPGSNAEYNMVAVRASNTKGVEINGGTASGLRAFLVNVGGQNLTVKNVTIKESNVGMELGAVRGVTVEGVTITSTVGKYGISMDASVNNDAKFINCNIKANVPIMVYNAKGNGNIAFSGTNKLGTENGKYWIILADDKYSDKAEGTDPETLSTTGRIVITVNDTGLTAAGINDKYQDGNKYYTVAPQGKLESAVVFDDATVKGDSNISLDIQNLVASERVMAEIYDAAGKKIAETKLVNKDVLYTTPLTGVVEIARNSSSWETTWFTDEKCPTYKNVPATAKLYVDGALKGEVPVEMYVKEIPADARIWTDVEGVGNLTVTTGGKTFWKHSLAEAFEAVPAKGKGTVTLFEDNEAILFAAGEVIGDKTITVTGKATFDWGKDWLFIGRGANTGNGTLIFDGATIKAAESKLSGGDVGIHVSGKENGEANKNNGDLQIVGGSSIETDYVVNRNYVLVDEGSTLNIKYGLYNHGRPASETPDGKDATATIDVTGGATLKIQKEAVSAVLGEEGHGELNVDGATFICEAPLTITEKDGTELNVSGISTLNIKKITGKAVNLLAEATLKDSTIGGNAIVKGTKEKPIGVTLEGKNTVGNLELVYGEVSIDTESLLTADKIVVETTDVNKIIIDASKLGKEPVKVIDLTNGTAKAMTEMVSVKDNIAAKKVGTDGDVTVYFEAYIDKDKNGEFTVGEGYATVEQAVAAAKDNETVVVLADVSVEAAIEINKKIVLDLNKHKLASDATNIAVLKVTASGAAVKNGEIYAVKSGNVGVEVAKDAAVEVTGVKINGKTAGVKAYGSVTVGADTTVTAQGSVAIYAYDNATVIVNGGTVSKADNCAIELHKAAALTVNSGEVSGAPAVRIFGGTLTVNNGKVTGKSGNAIVTCSDGSVEGDIAATDVIINNGNISGAIVAKDDEDGVVPKNYKVSVTIKGGNFTNSALDEDYLDKDYASIAVSGGIYDKWVPIEMCALDYTCRKIKDSNPVKYEVVKYEHVRIFMDKADRDADGIDKVIVDGDIYVDGNPFQVQPGKIILVDKKTAKNSAMFITTYAYEDKGTAEVKDDYPIAMYVWYAEGADKNNDGICDSYKVTRVEALDNFFRYNGTSIRVGGSDNGIRFFSSVDAGDAAKLMKGTLISGSENVLAGAKMTKTGTEFWKRVDNKLRSEVFGGAAGKTFRVFTKKDGRNWFTGVLVGLNTDGQTIYEPIYSRPYAEVKVGDKTMILYGGILERSILYVAEQNKDIFTPGTSYDKFVEGLIKKGNEYKDSLNNSADS